MIPPTDIFGNPYPSDGRPSAFQVASAPRFSANGGMVRNGSASSAGGRLVINDEFPSFLESTYLMRAQWLQSVIDPRRDLDKECGYPQTINLRQYRYMYEREGIATRVNDIYPDECWAVDPEIYEGEEPNDSDMVSDWKDLISKPEADPLHFLHRIDCMSGIGRYGVLLSMFEGKSLRRAARTALLRSDPHEVRQVLPPAFLLPHDSVILSIRALPDLTT